MRLFIDAKSRYLFVEGALGGGSGYGWWCGGAEIQPTEESSVKLISAQGAKLLWP
jgi:hypothetical protein